jgi:hypothetical protein
VTLLCPAAAINVIDGQNVFLVAALIVGGIGLMASRPVLAGLLLGLLTFKPQFCILVPLALIAAGQWRTFFAAGASALATVAVSSLIFGWDLWLRWFPLIIGNLLNPDEKWISYGRMWGERCAAGDTAAAGVMGSNARHARRSRFRHPRVPVRAEHDRKNRGPSGRDGSRRAAFRGL